MIINEYSNKETTDGDATIYAEKIQTKAIDAAKPKNKNLYRGYFPSDVNGKEGLDIGDLKVTKNILQI